ncbi:MAG: glycosyltransferase [Patescibacteria group bacterium]|jgi:glycosyltransferase involved in cell wall biosynthesis
MSFPFADGNTRSVAAIVPALNEEKTVGDVVRVLKASKSIGEVVVVDDGSVDRTSEEAKRAGARVVRLDHNVGKGGALLAGAQATTAGIFFFCDADFIGLTPAHVERLLAPVKEGRLVMCAGLRDRGPLVTRVIAHLPLLSGERALERRVLEAVVPRFLEGFRVEMALNYACRARGWRYGSIPTLGVGQVRKMQKIGFWRGLAAYAKMIWEIGDALIRVRLAKKEFLHT